MQFSTLREDSMGPARSVPFMRDVAGMLAPALAVPTAKDCYTGCDLLTRRRKKLPANKFRSQAGFTLSASLSGTQRSSG